MTTQEKAKAYDEAFKEAEKIHKFSSDIAEIKRMEQIFPKLAESKDERIRKGLIKAVSRTFEGNKLFGTDVTREEALAWLEKQGEKKPTDNIEPKFKVGDWITNGDYTWKIVEVEPLDYILQSQDGNIVDDTTSHVDEQFHSFTIEDAKDGDVLACEYGWTCIFKTLVNEETFSSYCFMDKTKWFCETGSECHTLNKKFMKAYNGEIKPATKEQRDTLFAKIHEAGYIWDAEKKELKKSQRMVSADAKEALYDKPTWSEGDEEMLKSIMATCELAEQEHDSSPARHLLEMQLNWLKTIKQKIGG